VGKIEAALAKEPSADWQKYDERSAMTTGARDQPLVPSSSTPYRSWDEGGYVTGSGWIDFAVIMLGLAGVWNMLNGLLAIGDSRVFVGDETFVFSDLNTWGWIILILGALQLLAAFAVVRGSEFARWFGVGVAGLNAIGQLYFLPAFPLWSMAIFAVDILIIYGLTAYGGKRLKAA
jgi:hypothetical protein